MDNKRELSMDEMNRAVGGTGRTVNTGVSGLNAALREQARKSSKQIGSIPNGTRLDVNDSTLTRDPESGRNFVYVICDNGKTGWVAASIVGLPR